MAASHWYSAIPFGHSESPLGGTPGTDVGGTFADNLALLGRLQSGYDVSSAAGKQNITGATRGLDQASAYDTAILSGNREQVLQAEAPEISSLLASYDSSRKAAAELTPRGGGRSATLNELPYREAGDVGKLIQSARPKAAEDLTRVASAQSYLGATEQQLSQSSVQQALNFLLQKAGFQLDFQQLQGANGQQAGQAAGQLAAALLMSGGA